MICATVARPVESRFIEGCDGLTQIRLPSRWFSAEHPYRSHCSWIANNTHSLLSAPMRAPFAAQYLRLGTRNVRAESFRAPAASACWDCSRAVNARRIQLARSRVAGGCPGGSRPVPHVGYGAGSAPGDRWPGSAIPHGDVPDGQVARQAGAVVASTRRRSRERDRDLDPNRSFRVRTHFA